MDKILSSALFTKSAILSKFFRFIVTETLNGNELTLKEYVIGTRVLKKDTDFNPQLDAVVRIHGGRLRKLLDEYYETYRDDEVKISIPKGRYIPVFERIHESPKKAEFIFTEDLVVSPETIPLIAVIPFKNYENNERVEVICSLLCQELYVELSRFSELGVISGYSAEIATARIEDKEQVLALLGADYMITGSCLLEANNLKVFFELHSVAKKQLIWAESYQIEDIENNKLKNFISIIKKVLAVTCGYFGIIYRNTLNAGIPQDYDYLYAVYWHNKYHQNYSEEAFVESSKAIEIALQKKPESSLLNSFKAQMLLDLCVMDLQDGINYYDMGFKLTQKALDLDPNNQHAAQNIAWAYLIGHNKKMCLQKMEECIALNPNNSMHVTAMGFGYICAGEYETGIKLLTESVNMNPYSFWLGNVGLCLYFLKKGDYSEALYWSSRIQRPGLLWDHLLHISISGLLGRTEGNSAVIEKLFALSPQFDSRAAYIVDVFLLDKDLQNIILKGLKKAGIKIK